MISHLHPLRVRCTCPTRPVPTDVRDHFGTNKRNGLNYKKKWTLHLMRWSNEWGTRIQLVASTPAPRSGRGQIFFFLRVHWWNRLAVSSASPCSRAFHVDYQNWSASSPFDWRPLTGTFCLASTKSNFPPSSPLRFDPLALDRPIQLGHRGGGCAA